MLFPVFLVLGLMAAGHSQVLEEGMELEAAKAEIDLEAALDSMEKRIINGQKAELFSHPYIISLQHYVRVSRTRYGWAHICGGTLIAKNWVLTAAHCVDTISPDKVKSIQIEIGAMNLYTAPNQYTQKVKIAEVIVHEGWGHTDRRLHNDIALLRLEKDVTLNENAQIATMAKPEDVFLGETCILAGWGYVETNSHGGVLAHDLQEVKIKQISTKTCNKFWRWGITGTQICVHDLDAKSSACQGDSGGPMMCGPGNKILAGVTSWGDHKCTGNMPSIYTRVSAFRDWIFRHAQV